MVCFFLSLIKRKLPQGCPKREGGQGHFWTMSKSKRLFFWMSSLSELNNGDAVCKTAPSKPGLSQKYEAVKRANSKSTLQQLERRL